MPWSRVAFAYDSLNGLKWLAVLFMVLDHINVYLLGGAHPWMFHAGRLSMPLFAIVLGLNLARVSRADQARVHARTAFRLALFGVLAAPAHMALTPVPAWGGWTLNIMFTFLVAVWVVRGLAWQTPWGTTLAIFAFLFGGLVVEYSWPGIALLVSVWGYQKRPGWFSASLFLLSMSSVCIVNGNGWAWAALPVAALCGFVSIPWPRAQWFFYVFYPAHLYLIWAVRDGAVA